MMLLPCLPEISPIVQYYADDANIPCSFKEQLAFYMAARNVLLDQLVLYRRELANIRKQQNTIQ